MHSNNAIIVLVLVTFMIHILVIALFNSNFVHISQKHLIISLTQHSIINYVMQIVNRVLDYQQIVPHAIQIIILYLKINYHILSFVLRIVIELV